MTTDDVLAAWKTELAEALGLPADAPIDIGVVLDLARDGKLHDKETLRAEVRRMLADPKAGAFAESFPRQWLQLRRVGMFPPDKVLYPEYDENLEQSMVAETVGFFGEVLQRNGSLREFLDSDWTLLNERLATHYGIPGVLGDKLRRVTLRPPPSAARHHSRGASAGSSRL